MIEKLFIARSFVVLAIVAGLVACGGLGGSPNAGLFPAAGVGMLASSPIKHVIIVIQENRSFDNLFATFPGADGTKTGKAAAMPPAHRAQLFASDREADDRSAKGNAHLAVSADIDHIYSGYKLELDRKRWTAST